MKISELAHYRELLQELKPRDSLHTVMGEMDAVLYLVANRSIKMPVALANLQRLRDVSCQSINQFDQEIASLIDSLSQQIQALEPSYLARAYQLYGEMQYDSVEYVLNRRLTIGPELQTYIQSRVQAHSDYHHAGMIIRPGLEDWIEHMVACDP